MRCHLGNQKFFSFTTPAGLEARSVVFLVLLTTFFRISMTKRYEYLEKPAKCPECGSARIADILYGLIAVSEKLEAEIKG